MMLHAGDLIRMQRCPRLAWLQYHHSRKQPLPFYHMKQPFSQLWSRAFGLENTCQGQRGDTMEDTFRLLEPLEPGDSVRHVRVSWNGLRVCIPWLKKLDDGWQAIWPMLTAREQEAWTMKLAVLIAARNGIFIRSQLAVSLNRDYVRQGSLDLDQLFVSSSRLENRRHHATRTIEELQETIDIDLDDLISQAQKLFSGPCPEAVNSRQCALGKRCDEYDGCFGVDARSGNDTLFLRTVPGRFLLPEGPISQLDADRLQDYPTAMAQYHASLDNPWVDRERLREWMKDVKGPFSYLDFEWDTFAVPPYPGMKPFDVLCFQFSLHTEAENKLVHESYFGWGDCRKAFMDRLISAVPDEGTIFVYNMEGAEMLRLKQLARQFPEYEKPLQRIWSRMKDLSKPFENGMYYDLRMKGRFSLKQIVTLFTDDPVYGNLEIHDGLQAVRAYREYETADCGLRRRIAAELDRYCGMDTYAEYLVLHGLEQVMED